MHESETSAGLSSAQKTVVYQPGTIVRVTQQIARRYDTITNTVTGKVIRQERQRSGSWYARNPRGKIWLDRLLLEKADGEVSVLNLDEYSAVEVLEGPPAVRGEGPLVLPSEDASASVT